MTVFDCSESSERASAVADAARAVARGDLIVMPTDTVYGVAADAKNAQAVTRLLAAKGRGRQMPPPVLVAQPGDLAGIVQSLDYGALRLAKRFWPGGLTLVLPADPGLTWDLGDLKGSVAVRIPDHPLALELLSATGPLAVSSANLTGQAPALTAEQASAQLGDSVSVYLEAGLVPGGQPSTIVSFMSETPRIVRSGPIGVDELREIVPGILADQ